MLVPVVAIFSCLFCGVWGFCVKCQSTFTAFSHVVFSLVPVNCYRWVHFFWPVAGTDARKGSLCLVSGSRLGLLGGVELCRFITLCVCGTWYMCRIGVILSVFSFFLLCDDGKKGYHSYFITTCIIPQFWYWLRSPLSSLPLRPFLNPDQKVLRSWRNETICGCNT